MTFDYETVPPIDAQLARLTKGLEQFCGKRDAALARRDEAAARSFQFYIGQIAKDLRQKLEKLEKGG